jgi:hypothetical protein
MLLLGFSACQLIRRPPSRFLMVFIDVSASTSRDRGLYETYLNQIVNSLKPGDRFLVGKISDETVTNFVPLLNTLLPKFNPMFDNPIKHKKALQGISLHLKADIDSLMAVAGATQRTEIIDCFNIAESYFSARTEKKVLVLISDMLECSSEMNFERETPTAAFIASKLDELAKQGRIARLEKVDVIVAGAGGSGQTGSRYRAVESFWRSYISETGGILMHYSHALMGFDLIQ